MSFTLLRSHGYQCSWSNGQPAHQTPLSQIWHTRYRYFLSTCHLSKSPPQPFGILQVLWLSPHSMHSTSQIVTFHQRSISQATIWAADECLSRVFANGLHGLHLQKHVFTVAIQALACIDLHWRPSLTLIIFNFIPHNEFHKLIWRTNHIFIPEQFQDLPTSPEVVQVYLLLFSTALIPAHFNTFTVQCLFTVFGHNAVLHTCITEMCASHLMHSHFQWQASTLRMWELLWFKFVSVLYLLRYGTLSNVCHSRGATNSLLLHILPYWMQFTGAAYNKHLPHLI